jgi:hypothetical protein
LTFDKGMRRAEARKVTYGNLRAGARLKMKKIPCKINRLTQAQGCAPFLSLGMYTMPDGLLSLESLNGQTSIEVPVLSYGDTGRVNTWYFWGNFDGADVSIQAAPARLNDANDITSKEWFDVIRSDGTSAKFLTKGTINVVGRAAYFRLLMNNFTALTTIQWEVR